ncbi:MAG: hypothetical protein QM621_11195 [Aeromicrobium sp.]|uniref:hypothetical protein n=1 Tax=Aeromicrobium sp. TaxID=1871063 RepID=UPI0039E39E7D
MNLAQAYEGIEADRRLEALGLSRRQLSQAIRRADAEAAQVTPLDPPTAEGWSRYAATVRYLREGLMPHGWDYDNGNNFCRTVAPGKRFAIVVSSGDSMTGNPHGNPSTKYTKGPTTSKAVDRNQYVLDFGPDFMSEDHEDDEYPIWYLIQYVDGNVIRAELSLPNGSHKGKITQWAERIILDEIVLDEAEDGNHDQDSDDDGDAYDVDIARR